MKGGRREEEGSKSHRRHSMGKYGVRGYSMENVLIRMSYIASYEYIKPFNYSLVT